ncbi:unnamed protein product [Thlaspi arvense]|uniref:Uncharacterized protein n=1 Tax=Thlaspi arvense TaxID=13288 RepID=A0AAU9S4J7_THLAR|nr:unnamed protein product [Thlaspi arvense]
MRMEHIRLSEGRNRTKSSIDHQLHQQAPCFALRIQHWVNTSVRKIFAEHVVKTEYKNVLSNACSKLSEMAEVGSKLDWLKSRLDEVSLKRKKADDVEGSRVQKLEERIKNLELMDSGLKMDGLRSNLEEILLERKKSYDANESRVQKLEERVKNLEMMELNVKLLKLEEVSLERKKSDDADDSRVQQLEESFKNLEMIVSDLKVELDHATKSSVDEIFLVEESFKNLEMMVLELKAEMEEGNAKYSSDEFFLVDEVE